MSRRTIIDAGPGLNFFSINQERLLISVLGRLCAPEAVETEILNKARQDKRFAGAENVWQRLKPNYMQILSDVVTDDLAYAVARICGTPFSERLRRPQDLGETMVVAHAAVAGEAGENVIILIDDGEGSRIAASEARRLGRMRASGSPVGTIRLVSTLTVLERAAGSAFLPNRSEMRKVYGRLRELDDGLLPLENTRLLAPENWR